MGMIDEIMEMDEIEQKELIAKVLLKSIGVDEKKLEFINQGSYNTVFKGPHPDPNVTPGDVALRVAIGPKKKSK